MPFLRAKSRKPIYEPLDSSVTQIRLLRLLKGRRGDQLRGEVFSVTLGQTPEIEYDALSYEWGSSQPNQRIELHGHSVQIRDTLHSALSSIREAERDRFLWIDALCIDQENSLKRISK